LPEYISDCPIHKNHEVEWNFAGNNGYVGFCNEDSQGVHATQHLLYYCLIFGNVSVFDRIAGETKEIPMNSSEFRTPMEAV